jgi:hypothetical protein
LPSAKCEEGVSRASRLRFVLKLQELHHFYSAMAW